MTGFSIEFTYPWLLLLLIPAAVLTVLPYFFLNKKYRRTRNRIISMVMHGLVMLFAILALSGMTFNYTIHNEENEVLLLVDVSDTEQTCAERRDTFINEVINESAEDGYRIGVVTFGFDQRYIVPFTSDAEGALAQYYAAEELPDVTATDIAAALRYAQTLFRYPESAKIVLVTDGKQTDENARSVVRSIAAQGIRVDTVNISGGYESDGLQVTNVVFPDYHVGLNEEFTFDVELLNTEGNRTASIEILDNGEKMDLGDSAQFNLLVGTQTVSFRNSFATQGVHEIEINVTLDTDAVEENNRYRSYFNVEVFSGVLILEQKEGQSDLLKRILETEVDGVSYQVTVLGVGEAPSTIDELCKYDQVILNNIANSDLNEGFADLLYEYVYNIGGGLFTTGGTEIGDSGDAVAHSYNRADLANTRLQQMLPVQAIDYTPPVGVEFVIDVSGSMSSGDKLHEAQQGAINCCLNVLTERDFVGVVTLSTTYGVVLDLTPRTQIAKITEAINSVTSDGSTKFSVAIRRAGDALKTLKQVEKRHIVVVTDGGANSESENDYLNAAKQYYQEDGITISVVGIEMSSTDYTAMKTLTDATGGKVYNVEDPAHVSEVMMGDLSADEIKETDMKTFNPIITDPLHNLAAGLERGEEEGDVATQWVLSTTLDGFFGTRARSSADTVMVGEYNVPIYSQWKVGEGMVGSFMCDVYGDWSAAFMADKNGQRFLRNVIGNLMPMQDIHSQEIKLSLREENYFNQLNISANLGEGDTVSGTVERISGSGGTISLLEANEEPMSDFYVTGYLNEGSHFSVCNFVIKTPGLYRITVTKHLADGGEVSAVMYKSFSYSAEYAEWKDTDGETDSSVLLAELAERGGGKTIAEDEPWNVFAELIPEIHRTFDPRILFMVLSIVLFLIDIIVRKFKFKWLHEIIREHKEKKAEEK